MSGKNYLAAVGSVRVWETRLLGEAEEEKMLGARSFEEAFQVLHDLDFAEFMSEAKGAEDFEKVLHMGLYDTKRSFGRLVTAPELEVLWLLYDLHNTKVLLKSKILEKSTESSAEIMLPYASRSPQKLEALLKGEQGDPEDEWIRNAIEEATREYATIQDPLKTEYVLDQYFFEKILEKALECRNGFVLNFVRRVIDTTNILTAFRLLLREQTDFPFLNGGTISKNLLLAADWKKFGNDLPPFWKEIMDEGKEDFEKNHHLVTLENKLTEAVLDALFDQKFVIDGPEPLIAFFWRKQHTARIIRTILVGKRAQLPEEKIRHSLPKLY